LSAWERAENDDDDDDNDDGDNVIADSAA